LFSGKSKYQAFWSLPFDLAVIPIALGYYFIGRFFLAKTLVATEKCNGCKACVEQCPVQAIQWKKERPFWSWKCESCMRCANICPERAIETAHLFSILVIYASIWTAGILFTNYFLSFEWVEQFIKTWMGDLFWDLLQSAFMVLYIFVAYRILHVLMGKVWFSKIIRKTSLSSYSWWRRYRPKKVVKF
jgi:Pyruvate/2-oxoacid:ferredoxin oxidoreductase delta subunit